MLPKFNWKRETSQPITAIRDQQQMAQENSDDVPWVDTPNYTGPCRRAGRANADIHPRRRYTDLLAELDPRYATTLPGTPLGQALETVRDETIAMHDYYSNQIAKLKKSAQALINEAIRSEDMAVQIASSALKRYLDSTSRDHPLHMDVLEHGVVQLIKLLESQLDGAKIRYESAISFEKMVDRKLGKRWSPRPLPEIRDPASAA